MKVSIIIGPIITALGATFAVGVAGKEGFEIRVRRNTTDGDKTLAADEAVPVLEVPTFTNATSLSDEMFDPADNSKIPDHMDPGTWKIPVSHWGCTGKYLGEFGMKKSMEKLVNWTLDEHWIEYKSIHYETVENTTTYVCNCKYCCRDKVPMSEMWEVYYRVKQNCGFAHSGWVFSKKWEKGYAFLDADYVDNKRTKTNLCPKNCSVM
ncbi:hypothetical protein F4819DRAFT_504181 [Hypoxylon fuscum]|nr:hypothetical protein F4819DRAFT_504181 [Hypoxylon fuscum]